jgi:hypothetical protein
MLEIMHEKLVGCSKRTERTKPQAPLTDAKDTPRPAARADVLRVPHDTHTSAGRALAEEASSEGREDLHYEHERRNADHITCRDDQSNLPR